MHNGRGDSPLFQRWEELYKDALFEAEMHRMPRRIELAKHAILDRLEDANCPRNIISAVSRPENWRRCAMPIAP
jgi:hypothetical protein